MADLPFNLNFLNNPDQPWGPPKTIPVSLRFNDIPYAPFSKSDKLGKSSDWFANEQSNQTKNQRNFRDPFHAYGDSAASKFASDKANDNIKGFEVVDNKVSSNTSGGGNHQKTLVRGRGGNKGRQGGQPSRNTFGNRTTQQTIKKAAPSVPQTAQQQRASYWNTQNQNQIDDATKRKKVSIDIKPNHTKITEIDFSKLAKLNLDLGINGAGETLAVKANPSLIKQYNKSFDKLSSSSTLKKTTIPLKVFAKEAPNSYVDTLHDEELNSFAKDDIADVLITDDVLATIMSCHKSNFPWNIKIIKDVKTGKLYFSQSEPAIKTIVDENDNELFATSFHADDNSINSYGKLSNELNAINYNLTKFASSSIPPKLNSINGNTIENDANLKSNKVVKYKLYKIPEDTTAQDIKKSRKLTLAKQDDVENPIKYINIAIRSEADLVDSNTSGEYETIQMHALNQYKASALDWKSKLISNRGAIISTELRKNNNLFFKWIISAILGDIDNIKLGFVARDTYNSTEKHTILGLFNYKPTDLARQSNLQVGNGWAIFKSIIDIVNHESEGFDRETVEFILARDPVQAKVCIYRVD